MKNRLRVQTVLSRKKRNNNEHAKKLYKRNIKSTKWYGVQSYVNTVSKTDNTNDAKEIPSCLPRLTTVSSKLNRPTRWPLASWDHYQNVNNQTGNACFKSKHVSPSFIAARTIDRVIFSGKHTRNVLNFWRHDDTPLPSALKLKNNPNRRVLVAKNVIKLNAGPDTNDVLKFARNFPETLYGRINGITLTLCP